MNQHYKNGGPTGSWALVYRHGAPWVIHGSRGACLPWSTGLANSGSLTGCPWVTHGFTMLAHGSHGSPVDHPWVHRWPGLPLAQCGQ